MKTNHNRKFFYLKPVKTNGINKGKCLVMLSYFCQDRKRFKLSTKIYIPKKSWSDQMQRILPSFAGATELNISLGKFIANLEQIISNLKADGILNSPKAIQERYQELTQDRIKERTDRLFIPFFSELIGTKENAGRLSRKHKNSTVKTYKLLLRLMKSEEKNLGMPLTFETFTQEFMYEFSQRAIKSLGANTVRKRFSQLKTILSIAVKEKRTEFRDFESAKIEIKKVDPVTVYLSEHEISTIYNLRNNPEIQSRKDYEIICREADRIVLGCWLGLRWSDYSRINKENIYEREGKWFLTLETQKTEETVIIPIHPTALEILKRYNFSPPKISQQKANDLIKRVCKLANISESVSTPLGIRPKHEEVTTHTMRRSFATNLIQSGVPHYHVMKLGGWKSFASFERYIRLSKEEAAVRVAEVFAGNVSPMLKAV